MFVKWRPYEFEKIFGFCCLPVCQFASLSEKTKKFIEFTHVSTIALSQIQIKAGLPRFFLFEDLPPYNFA